MAWPVPGAPAERACAVRARGAGFQAPVAPAATREQAQRQGEPRATGTPRDRDTAAGGPALCVCQVLAGTTAPSRWGLRARRRELPLYVQRVRGRRPADEEVLCHHPHFKDKGGVCQG